MTELLIDARGLKCPLPLLKLKQAMAGAEAGDQFYLIAHDKGAWRDVPAYIKMTSHTILSQKHDQVTNEYAFLLVKGA